MIPPRPSVTIYGAFLLADRLDEDVRKARAKGQVVVTRSVDEMEEIARRIRALADVARDYHNMLQLTGSSTPANETIFRGQG